MPTFRYSAFDDGGALREGEIEARDRTQAEEHLWARGLTPFETRRTSAADPRRRFALPFSPRRAGRRDIAGFTRELATLIEAGLPLDDALRLLVDQTTHPSMARITGQLLAEVLDGRPLSAALRGFPDAFSGEYVAVVEAGEAEGATGRVLVDLADLLEKRLELQAKMRSALVYPALLLVMAVVSVAIVMAVLIPSVAPIFVESGRPLPSGLALVFALQAHGSEIAVAVAALTALAALAVQRIRAVPERRIAVARRYLALPLLGPLVAKHQIARFARTLAGQTRAGVPLVAALTTARRTITNVAMAADLDRAIEAVRNGTSVALALRDVVAMPALALRMITVGEETGRLQQMLVRLAAMFEAETQRTIDRAMTMLTPALTIVIAGLVGALVLSVMSAILSINELAVQ